jgi:hypothetical protein
MVKSRRMRLAGLVACIGRKGVHTSFGGKNLRKETCRKSYTGWKITIIMYFTLIPHGPHRKPKEYGRDTQTQKDKAIS